MARTTHRKTVVVVGAGRSGTTLLSNVLGSVPGFTSLGELCYLRESLVARRRCGCGSELAECELWSPVLDTVGIDSAPRDVEPWNRGSLRNRHVPRLLALNPGVPSGDTELDEHVDGTRRVMQEVASAAEAGVLIDSSKHAVQAALHRLTGTDTYALHLVRDPRAVAYSFVRDTTRPDADAQPMAHSPARAAALWSYTNVWASYLGKRLSSRYRRVRYENLVRDPVATVSEILAFIGEPGTPPFRSDGSIELAVNHTVAGNVIRFRSGMIRVHEDDDWRRDLPPRAWYAATAISLPMISAYGYQYLDGAPWRWEPARASGHRRV